MASCVLRVGHDSVILYASVLDLERSAYLMRLGDLEVVCAQLCVTESIVNLNVLYGKDWKTSVQQCPLVHINNEYTCAASRKFLGM